MTSTLLSCVHGRDRRKERKIAKADLHLARELGRCEPAGRGDRVREQGRLKYVLPTVGRGDLVFITDKTSKREITSYFSGQRSPPVCVDVELPVRVDPVPVAPADEAAHARAANDLRARPGGC